MKTARRSRSTSRVNRWSSRVMATSDALDLEEGVFKRGSARAVARSLKRSADKSHRRKSEPYRSAMSMLSFHINRAGKQLTPARKKVLEQAKEELRRLYGRDEPGESSGREPAKPRRSASKSGASTRTGPAPARKKTTARKSSARKPSAPSSTARKSSARKNTARKSATPKNTARKSSARRSSAR